MTKSNTVLNTIEGISNSHELFLMINKFREANGKKNIRNLYELHTKIGDEIGIENLERKKTCKLFTEHKYGSKGFEAYELSRSDVFLVSMRESKEVRKAIYFYIEELEDANKKLNDIIASVITSKAFLAQEMGMKCANIKHPRLLMQYIKEKDGLGWLEGNGLFGLRQVGKEKSDTAWTWSQKGFRWLIAKSDYLNDQVEKYKKK